MNELDRIHALIDLALSRGDRAAVLILQGRRRAHLQAQTAARINRTLAQPRMTTHWDQATKTLTFSR